MAQQDDLNVANESAKTFASLMQGSMEGGDVSKDLKRQSEKMMQGAMNSVNDSLKASRKDGECYVGPFAFLNPCYRPSPGCLPLPARCSRVG